MGVGGGCYRDIYFKKQGVRLWTGLIWLLWYVVVALCGHNIESLGSIKGRQLGSKNHLHNWEHVTDISP